LNNLLTNDYKDILSGTAINNMKFTSLVESIIQLTNVIEGAGAPSIEGVKHQWYFDTVAIKYYRNVDGGVTWVALN